jgi:hypothetical protein
MMERMLIASAVVAASLALAGLAEAQTINAPPPVSGSSPAAQSTTRVSPDPTLPYQAPDAALGQPNAASSINCEPPGPSPTGSPGALPPSNRPC